MSYYGFGTKELILTSLYNAAMAIPSIGFVDWQRIYDSSIGPERYPGIYVNDLREDRTQILKDIARVDFSVAIVGWVWALDNENLGTKLNTFITATKTAFRTDPTRGSQAYDTAIESITTDGGNRHPQGMFVMSLRIPFFSST
jgi:hypothetical protein